MIEAGADAALCKPCRESDLLEEIRRQLDLQYTYADAPDSDRTSAPPSRAPHGRAPRLPRDLRDQLRHATRVADYDGLLALIAQIPEAQATLGDELRLRVEQYDYEAVERALRDR